MPGMVIGEHADLFGKYGDLLGKELVIASLFREAHTSSSTGQKPAPEQCTFLSIRKPENPCRTKPEKVKPLLSGGSTTWAEQEALHEIQVG